MLRALRVLCALLAVALASTVTQAAGEELTFAEAQAKSEQLRAKEGVAVEATPDQLVLEFRNKEREANQTNFMVVTGAMIAALLLSLVAIHLSGNHSPEPLVMTSGLILIVYGALAVTLIATTHEQLTTPIGVLGAMAGYLFGRSSVRRQESASEKTKAQARSK